MMAAAANLLFGRSFLPVVLVIAALGFVGAYGYGRHVGFGLGENAAELRHRVATEALNRKLLDQATAHRLEVARFNDDRAAMSAQIEGLQDEARLDPDAARPALGADSVRRLNSVR